MPCERKSQITCRGSRPAGLGHAELDDALGRDLDLRAGGRIATETGFAINQHEFAGMPGRVKVFFAFLREGRDDLEDFRRLLF